jgi:flagellar biosynthesis repressor protein FlbT
MNMFKKSIMMLLNCFQNEEIRTQLKLIDEVVSGKKPFEALKMIRKLYPLEDQVLNTPEMTPATITAIQKEIAPWR